MRNLFVAMWLILLVVGCLAESIHCKVVGVLDGDTIDVLDQAQVQHRIRLAGIDAPEKHQAFGQKSKQSLSELVYNKEVVVETNRQDRYGRKVGKVLINSQDVNLEQIQRGMAWFYRQYERELTGQDRVLYNQAEQEAKAKAVGLWSDRGATEPWVFRRNK